MQNSLVVTTELLPINNYKINLYQLLSVFNCGYQSYKITSIMPLYISLLHLINQLQQISAISPIYYVSYPHYYHSIDQNNTQVYLIPQNWFLIKIKKNYQEQNYYIKYNEGGQYFDIYTKNIDPLYDYTHTNNIKQI